MQETTSHIHYARVNGVPCGKRKAVQTTERIGSALSDADAIERAREIATRYKAGAVIDVMRTEGRLKTYDDGAKTFTAALYGATTKITTL